MIHPSGGTAPIPNADLPDDIAEVYNEARDIANRSPRAAGALLRLAIQMLCVHLGKPGKNLNDDIGALVAEGLPQIVQQALDAVRVTGNNLVHPSHIQQDEVPEVVASLFQLVNLIAEKMISDPKTVEGIFQSLPEGQLRQITKRDNNSLKN